MHTLNPTLWPDTATISDGHLMLGGCDVTTLAAGYGTPLYLLDDATLRGMMRAYTAAFTAHYPAPFGIHYASKALLNTALAQIVAQEGLGLDVVSGTELRIAYEAGLPMEQLHFHGNAKTQAELERAVAWGVGAIVVDNEDELAQLATITAGRTTPQPILLRVAPGIAAHTHAHIATGATDAKFGLPLDALPAVTKRVLAAPGLRLRGLHAHIGSQIFDPEEWHGTIEILVEQAALLRDRFGLLCAELSPGGGLGTPYTADVAPTTIERYVHTLSTTMQTACATHNLPLPRLTVEPGRSIVARAGVAIYRIVTTKHSAIRYLHVDGGMADNIRPALYGAHYTALLANRAAALPTERVHIAGRYCESGDILVRDALLPPAEPGDLVAVAVAGAYTLSMASNYNLVPRPPLLLVANGRAHLIQRRETEDDLLARDLPLDAGEALSMI